MTDTRLYHGDCSLVLAHLEEASIDAVVTDPPAGIDFMGKAWDSNKGGRDQWVAWLRGVTGVRESTGSLAAASTLPLSTSHA